MNFSGFHYKILFEKVFDPIALYKVKESEITFIDVNPAYEKVMKVAREDVIGKTFHEIWPNAEALWSRVIIECLKQKRTTHCIGESLDAESYLEAIAFPIPPEMAAVIFLDRTKLKRSNNSLKNRQNQLRALAAQLTISEENTRRSIASDLHDRVGYDLISQLKILRHIQKLNGSENIEDLIQVLIDNTEKMISENRNLIFELSPPALKEAGLNPALEELAKNILDPNGINWKIISKGESEKFKAEDSVCVILYRMARELLINVVKHSGASQVNIIINRKPEIITVAVEDNGKGLLQSSSKGFGLFSIRERLLALGGNLKIISEPDNGLMAVMTCPLRIKNGEIFHDKNIIS